jgi:hypothetical protein
VIQPQVRRGIVCRNGSCGEKMDVVHFCNTPRRLK